jgi:hypothetical protein
VEVWGHFGGLFGLPDFTDVMYDALGSYNVKSTVAETGIKYALGGGVAVPVARKFAVVGECDLNRIGGWDFSMRSGGVTAAMGMKFTTLNLLGGVRFTLIESGVFKPYVSGGAGVSRLTATVTTAAVPADIGVSQSDAAYYFGGGVSIRAGRQFSIVPDVRFYQVGSDNYYRASVAFGVGFGA